MLLRGAFELTATGARFASGETFDADVIICCTGFKTKFPFLSAEPELPWLSPTLALAA